MESTLNIFDLFKTMSEYQIIFIYQGGVDQEMIKSVLSMTEKKLIQSKIDVGLRKKLFNILVEGLQNICKHQLNTGNANDNPFVVISKSPDSFNIVTGNLIENDKVLNLATKLRNINALTHEELKEYYKEARLKSVISAAGGAGLGFIDMARKSGNKLDFKFFKRDELHSFFILNNKVTNN